MFDLGVKHDPRVFIIFDEVYWTKLMTVFPLNLISNDFVHTVQCGLQGYDDAISPEFAGANSRAHGS